MPAHDTGYLQIILLLVFVVIAVLFLLTQQNTLKAVKPENRRMQPGLVWLQMIPLLGQVWQFFVIARIADSIKKERTSFREDSIVGISDYSAAEQWGKRPTYAMGLTYSILLWCNVLIEFRSRYDEFQEIHGLIGLCMMACWIIYWIQLAVIKKKIVRSAV
jgi:hypothetical protein